MAERSCIGCGAKRDKSELVRLVAPDGAVRVGRAHPGRGAYVCGPACAERALSRKALARAFKRSVRTGEELVVDVARAEAAQRGSGLPTP